MQIQYRIVDVQPEDQLIVVRYWSDVTPESELASEVDDEGNMVRCRTDVAIGLPVPTPTGAALDALIMANCPTAFFEMKAALADPNVDPGIDALFSLVNVDITPAPVVVTPAPRIVSRFQGMAALHLSGYLEDIETYMITADPIEQLAWETIQEFHEDSPLLAKLATILGLTTEMVADLFTFAATIKA